MTLLLMRLSITRPVWTLLRWLAPALCLVPPFRPLATTACQNHLQPQCWRRREHMPRTLAENRPADLTLFDEAIDFSLDEAVPDPVPFLEKLRNMLDKHGDFLRSVHDANISESILDEARAAGCRLA